MRIKRITETFFHSMKGSSPDVIVPALLVRSCAVIAFVLCIYFSTDGGQLQEGGRKKFYLSG